VQERVEREMLRLLARDPEAFAALAPDVREEYFQSAQHRALLRQLTDVGGDVRAGVANAQDDDSRRALSALALEPLDGEPVPGYADDVLARLREFALKRKSARLRKELQKMNPTTDERYDGLFQELIATDGELRRLRERGHVHA
jgi:DNA primase